MQEEVLCIFENLFEIQYTKVAFFNVSAVFIGCRYTSKIARA